ncbi:MAG: hypothetical protein ACRD0I_05020 [Acidimicrobiales bacterium]
MLSALDDLPIHQVAEVMRHVGPSDRNFYDRYYFNAHPCSDELFMVFGMGQYPNLGVADAFLVVRDAGLQQVVRASKELGADRLDTTVGPLHVEVIEGLRRLRVVCDENEWGLACDLTWTGAVVAYEEPRHQHRQGSRVIIDSKRMAQTGTWSGTLTFNDKTHQVTPDHWWGSRDRSWGIRPVGEPEPPGIQATRPPGGFFWLYAPMQFDEFSILFITQEESDGTRVLEEAVRVYPESAGRSPELLGRPDHELVFVSGTRTVQSAKLKMTEPDGRPLEVEVTPLLPLHVGMGTGYGFDADWRHGMYQGPSKVQSVSYDLNDPVQAGAMWGLCDSVARFRTGDLVGHGLFEYMVLGPHDRYGFAGWD